MTLIWMAAILDMSYMAPTEGAQLGSREKSKLYDLGYKWSKFGAFGTIWTIIWLSPLTRCWVEWDDTSFQTQDLKPRVLSVWSRARYLSVTEASAILHLYEWAGNNFCFFLTWMPERWTIKQVINSLIRGFRDDHTVVTLSLQVYRWQYTSPHNSTISRVNPRN